MTDKVFSFEDDIMQGPATVAEVAKEISQLTGFSQLVVRDVLDALTGVAIKNIVVKGGFRLPGVCTVSRIKTSAPSKKYLPNEDVTIELPFDFRVSAKVLPTLRQLSRDYTNGLIAKENGLEFKDWYKPFIIAEGHLDDGVPKITISKNKK